MKQKRKRDKNNNNLADVLWLKEVNEERMKLDNEYADHFIGNKYSFWYDLRLIGRTIPAMFQKNTV